MGTARRWVLAAAAAGVAGCQSAPVGERGAVVGDTATTLSEATTRASGSGVDRVQAQVMDFADDFTLRLADMADRIEARRPSMEARVAIHRLRYTVAHGLTVIAASANPKVALIDSVVVMSLQRRLVEERLIPKYFEDMPWIAAVFRDAEEQIKRYAAETLSAEQMDEIQALVDKWVEENPYRYYAAYVRLNDFASTRQQTQGAASARSSSLFSLLFLDPLAGLDPTTREIEQTRLFAERAMYYLQRMPQLMSWQAELLYIDTASEPEVEQALANMQSVATSVEILTADVADMKAELPAIIASEREAAIDQASERFFEGIGGERRAMLDDLAARSEELESTLGEFTRAFEAGDEFAGHSTELVQSVHALTDTVNAMRAAPGADAGKDTGAGVPAGAGASAGDPTSIGDYEHAIETATALVDKLDGLVGAVDELAKSGAWEERRATLDTAMGDAQARLEAVIDRGYRRGVWLVAIALGGVLGVGLVLKLVPGRGRA